MSAIGKYSFTVICIVMSIFCGASQIPFANQPSEKFSNYYQKPMRNLDIELMDEVLENASDDIKNIIETINDLHKTESIRLLLVGGPGVGKTTLAQAIAMQTNRPCFIIRAPSLANQYQFSGEQNLIAAISPLFEINEPCVVIIDEIDALKQYKGDKTNQDASPANTLCNLLDDAEDYPNIVFIATTNKLKQLPEDLKSRFGSIITLPLPDECARERIIRYHLEQFKKTGIHVEIDDKTIKSLAAKTKGFSARDLKAMVIKCKTFMRSVGVGMSVTHKQVWQAYKDEKLLIGSSWRIKERLKELTDNHGVALSTFALSTMLTIIGIILSERRSVQSMGQSQKQYSEQHEDQKKNRKKENCAKLIKEILAQDKLIQDPKIQANWYEFNHGIFMLRVLKGKLARRVVPSGSKEECYFKQVGTFWKKILVYFEKIDKHNLNKKAVEKFNHDWGQDRDNFEKMMCSEFKINANEFEQFSNNTHGKYDPKLTEMITLARSNEAAAEVNEGNEKSQTAAREREEADTWGSRIKNLLGTVVGAVAGGVATNKILIWLGWVVCAA